MLAFLFADLIVLPMILVYGKYYGLTFTIRIVALMFVTMAAAGLIVDGLFSVLGILPTGPRPSRSNIFGSVQVDYKSFLNVLGVVIFAALFRLTARRGVTDPVWGMKVDSVKAVPKQFGGQTFYFCSTNCLHAFEADPAGYSQPGSKLQHQHYVAAS